MRIIPKKGICDPHVHIYNGRAYLYATHDRCAGNSDFRMDDWHLYSSDDLLNWKLEYVLRPEDTYIGKFNKCYATDAAERNGKYYFYFSKDQESTGVAVSENGPCGPYRDALGKPLLPQGLVDTACYDPTVFIDDDKDQTPYIIFGYTVLGKQYYIARMNEDMISLAEEPRPIEIINGWANDANWVMKRNGVYYLNSHGGHYATAENIYGPYTYRGQFCHDATVDHGTFFTYHNQTYFTYGIPESWGQPHHDPFYRTTKMLYAHFTDNGDVVVDQFIQEVGVGQYDASWEQIQSEWYFAASESVLKRENASGFETTGFHEGSYLYYPNIHGMRQNALLYVCVANDGAPCTVEIREGSPFGSVLGCCKIENTGGVDRYHEFSCALNNTHGTHSLCFVFRDIEQSNLSLEYFKFDHIAP